MSLNIKEFVSTGPVITDGAWGTQLQARGLPVGACPDAWNLSEPDLVKDVARAYVEAGSQVILTNTFGASRISLARHGLQEQASAINRGGAEISRAAAGQDVRVFGSIGPTGAMLAMGEVSAEEMLSAFREQALALADGGVDAIVVETMSDLDEAKLALAAAKDTGLPVVVSMVYGAGKAKDRTMMGNTPEQCAEELGIVGADAIGANCGFGAAQMLPICQRLRAATDRPVWIKPNAGLPELLGDKVVYSTTPDMWTTDALGLVAAGADFIGGCCGSSPEFLKSLSASLRKNNA